MRLLFLLLACVLTHTAAFSQSITERDFKKHFDAYGLRGSFLVFDVQAKSYTAYDVKRCRQGFLPASTFKIPNTLIGLETGVIKDTSQVMKWDGVKRGFPQWNQDLTLANALRVSCVPCYQQVARGVGTKRYNDWLPKLKFGKMVVTEATVDTFWLTGTSRITQFEQIDFLRRLYADKLPVSVQNQRITKQLLLQKKTPTYQLHGKSGWTSQDRLHNNGWFVGWVQRTDGRVYFFALNAEPEPGQPADDKFVSGRRAITEKILAELSITD
jgi:beta-lactamase class D